MFEDGLDYSDLLRVFDGLNEIIDRHEGTSRLDDYSIFSQDPDVIFYAPFDEIADQGFRVDDEELLTFTIAVGERFIEETRREGLTVTSEHFEEVFERFLAVQGAIPIGA